MRYSPGMLTLCFVAIMLLAVLAVLGWIRPVRQVVAPDPYRVRFDSLATATASHQARAESAIKAAEHWRQLARQLHEERTNPQAAIDHAARTLHTADLDSLRAVLLTPPR